MVVLFYGKTVERHSPVELSGFHFGTSPISPQYPHLRWFSETLYSFGFSPSSDKSV